MSIRTPGVALLLAGSLAAAGVALTPAGAAATATPRHSPRTPIGAHHRTHWTQVQAKPALVPYYRRDRKVPHHLSKAAHLATAADGAQDSYVPAPATGPTQSTWQVTYTGFDAASNISGPAAKTAFQAAVTIWSQIVKSGVPIKVDADFASLPTGVLGEAGPSTLYSNGSSFYASALADAMAGTDISTQANGPSEDIDAQFSSSPSADFYFGTDGAPPVGEVDFESVVLHELGHGLGFLGSLELNSDGTTASRSASLPFAYDNDTTSAASGGTPLLSYPNDSTQLAAALQSQSVYWDGKVAVASNGGVRPRLFAPSSWEDGSSYSHLDESTYPEGNLNSLMTPALSDQEAVHNPGPIAVGMLVDQGWTATLPGLASVPGAPTGVTAAAADASATVSWTAAAANSSAVSKYVATASPGGQTCTTTGALTCTVTGLTDGTAYTFTVKATNGVGDSAASSPSSVVTPGGVPGAATAVTASAADGAAHVSWTAAPADGYAVSKYVTTASPGGATCTTTGALTCVVATLTNGTAYTFTVVATNSKGAGPASTPSAAMTPAGLPSVPTGVAATAGNTTAAVSWSASSGNGTTVTGYTTTSSPGSLTCTTTGATSCTVPDLTNGTAYTFTVTATSSAGTSAASTASGGVTPTGPAATTPDAPAAPSVVAGPSRASVSWSAPDFDGGNAVTGYDVEYSTDGTTWSSGASAFHTSAARTETVSGLANGTPYAFRVAAINAQGTGAYSAASGYVTPASAPAAPTELDADPGHAEVAVSWTAPTDDGAESILGYDLQYSATDGASWTSASSSINSSSLTSATVEHLTDDTAYVFRVAAINAVGTGGYSAVSTAAVPLDDATAIHAGARRTITYGTSTRLMATVDDTTTGTPIAAAVVWLQSREGATGAFNNAVELTGSATGAVATTVKPTVTTQYRWQLIGVVSHADAASAIITVSVAHKVSAFRTAKAVRVHRHVVLYGVVGPAVQGQIVRLQRRAGARWRTIAVNARLVKQRLPNGTRAVGFLLSFVAKAKGHFVYRVYCPGSGQNSAGASRALRIRVS